MIDLTKVRNYYIACGYTDLRLGIDGLAAVVTAAVRKPFRRRKPIPIDIEPKNTAASRFERRGG